MEIWTVPNIEIPDFLLEMSKQMNEQPTRCTAEPIWQVRCNRYLATEEGVNEHHFEIIDEEGSTLYSSLDDDCNNLAEYLRDYEEEFVDYFMGDKDGESLDEALLDEIMNGWFDFNELPSNLRKVHLQEVEEVIKTCLTEYDANCFIKRKQHDYPKLYTYVDSMVFCPQMIELRNWIMSLTAKDAA